MTIKMHRAQRMIVIQNSVLREVAINKKIDDAPKTNIKRTFVVDIMLIISTKSISESAEHCHCH